MSLCKLCLQDRPLVEGKILTEFLYAEHYDCRHRFHQLHTDESKRNKPRPKGLYERMMCADCDNRIISGYETYASQVLNGGVEIVVTNRHDRVIVSELDYTRFKLFQLSLLWRSVISTRDEFAAVNVSAEHAERMRQMLLDEDPGEPHEYGCALFLPARRDLLRQAIMPPDPVRISGHRGFRLLAGGFFWLYLVSRHTHAFEHQALFLSRDGTLQIIREGEYSSGFMHELFAELVRNPTFSKRTM